jgi:hypothetical protein
MLTAEEILQRSIEVMGNQAAHAKIKTMLQQGTFSLNGSTRKGRILSQFKSPNKARVVQFMPNGHVVKQVFDGQSLWEQAGNTPVQKASLYARDEFQMHSLLDSPLRWREFYTHVEIGGKETVLRHTTHTLRFTTKTGQKVLHYIDVKTFLLLRVDYRAHTKLGPILTQTYLSNYKNIGGIQVPFKVQTILPTGSVVTVLDKVVVNIPVVDAQFSSASLKTTRKKPSSPPTHPAHPAKTNAAPPLISTAPLVTSPKVMPMKPIHPPL